MIRAGIRAAVAALSVLLAPAIATAQRDSPPAAGDAMLESMLEGHPPIDQAALAERVAEAERHPLGSDANPVRVERPQGQRAYLARLRCADGRAPAFARRGNVGPGIYGSIVDLYELDCGAAAPGRVEVRLDMYHGGHVEDRPLPGFTIAPRVDGGPPRDAT